MPAPCWLARFNLDVTNPLLGALQDKCPGWELSCMSDGKPRQDRTPVLLFYRSERVIIALTYEQQRMNFATIDTSGLKSAE